MANSLKRLNFQAPDRSSSSPSSTPKSDNSAIATILLLYCPVVAAYGRPRCCFRDSDHTPVEQTTYGILSGNLSQNGPMPALLFLCYQDRTARCAIVLYYFYPGANRGKASSQARTIRLPNLLQGRGRR